MVPFYSEYINVILKHVLCSSAVYHVLYSRMCSNSHNYWSSVYIFV